MLVSTLGAQLVAFPWSIASEVAEVKMGTEGKRRGERGK
jgi:hypothetical protein